MKKKFLLALMFVVVGVSLFGCGKTTLDHVKANMSEWTKVYYLGETENCYASISSGVREKKYLMNGQSEEKTAFALLSVTLDHEISSTLLRVKLTIDDEQLERAIEFNTLNNSYMVDLERELKGTENIELTVTGQTFKLNALSNDFVVDDEKALEIASREFDNEITKKKNFNSLNAEMYLRILDKNANNFDDVFWCFTVLNVDNESFSIVISTVDGSILAKTK